MPAQDVTANAPADRLVARTLKRWFLRPSRVSRVEDLSAHFRLIDLQGEALQKALWMAGQHIQVSMGLGLDFRTYTPMFWDNERGCTQILVYLHGGGPGCVWAETAKVGDYCEFFGPHKSLEVPKGKGPLLFFGDETCFGLAAALQRVESQPVDFIFDVSDKAESLCVLEAIGLQRATLIERTTEDGHFHALESSLSTSAQPDSRIAFTGNARAIQRLKKLSRKLFHESSRISVKPYWAAGKVGLN